MKHPYPTTLILSGLINMLPDSPHLIRLYSRCIVAYGTYNGKADCLTQAVTGLCGWPEDRKVTNASSLL
jgi:hypothetical protein